MIVKDFNGRYSSNAKYVISFLNISYKNFISLIFFYVFDQKRTVAGLQTRSKQHGEAVDASLSRSSANFFC